MLIIERKEGEHIERLLGRYRRKRRTVKLKRTIQQQQHFVKPSIKRRTEILKAVYKNKKQFSGEESTVKIYHRLK